MGMNWFGPKWENVYMQHPGCHAYAPPSPWHGTQLTCFCAQVGLGSSPELACPVWARAWASISHLIQQPATTCPSSLPISPSHPSSQLPDEVGKGNPGSSLNWPAGPGEQPSWCMEASYWGRGPGRRESVCTAPGVHRYAFSHFRLNQFVPISIQDRHIPLSILLYCVT